MYDTDLPLVNLTFARQINAQELLERMGVDHNTVAVRGPDDFRNELGGLLYADDGYVVSAGHYRSWAWAWEHGSWKGIQDRAHLPVPRSSSSGCSTSPPVRSRS